MLQPLRVEQLRGAALQRVRLSPGGVVVWWWALGVVGMNALTASQCRFRLDDIFRATTSLSPNALQFVTRRASVTVTIAIAARSFLVDEFRFARSVGDRRRQNCAC
jgi:hypothetical protein